MVNVHSRVSNWVVLVVDDEPDSIYLVTEVLNFYGATVYGAKDGVEALAMLERITPDVVLTDLSMPRMDGWTLISKIREHPTMSTLPVVALTAGYAGDRERGLAAGFTSFLNKPIKAVTLLTDLLERVESLP